MEQTKENKMGTMPVNKLLVTMSLPMVISMIVQALYNIVDSIFVSRLSEDALTAVSMAFPMQNLMISVAVGTWVLNIQEFVCLCHLAFLCRLVLKEYFNPQDEQYSQ